MRIVLPLAALASLVTSSALAQDKCADVLAQGTFQTVEYRSSNYFQQIIYSQFVSSTYQSSKTDRAGGFGVPVGEIVLGGNYGEAEYNQKKAELQTTYFNQLTSDQKLHIALSSGDPVVVGAWKDCMGKRGGGLTVRFEATNAREVLALVEFFPNGPHFEAKLREDVVLPGATIVTGKDCFRKNTKIRAGNPCRATLKMDSALRSLTVSVNSSEGPAAAYLPPRITLVKSREPVPPERLDKLFRSVKRNYLEPVNTVRLTPDEIRDGWTFDTADGSYSATVHRLYGGGMNKCWDPYIRVEPQSFTYGYKINGHTRGNDSNWSINCEMHVNVSMKRELWLPQDWQQGSDRNALRSATSVLKQVE